MGTSLVTGPTSEPISLADARAQCKLTHELDDAVLAGLILNAREWAQGETRRAFVAQTWDYFLPYFPIEIELPTFPVQSVTSITYVDLAGATQTVSSSAYDTDLKSIVPRIRCALGYSWPATKDTYNAVTVRYVAGYTAGHPDLLTVRTAMLLHVEAHYDRDPDNFDKLMKAADATLAPLRINRL